VKRFASARPKQRRAHGNSFAFLGADQTVTGSSHHLECAVRYSAGLRLFQGGRTLPTSTRTCADARAVGGKATPGLNAVVLSHAHIDHSGDLPLLAKQGYRGRSIQRRRPSTCACDAEDSAHIQESDAEFISKRHGRRQEIKVPPGRCRCSAVYADDAAQVCQQLKR